MAEINVKTTPRFKGSHVAAIGFLCIVLFGLLVWVLINASTIFDPTTSARGGKTTDELATAKFAIVFLFALGGSVLVAAFALALTEVTTQESTAKTPDAAAAEVATRAVTASGIGAVLVAAGETAKALAAALKGLTASAMLVVMGGLLVITGGAVAWQTIPGTDRSPTIQTAEPSPSPTPTARPPTPTASPNPTPTRS